MLSEYRQSLPMPARHRIFRKVFLLLAMLHFVLGLTATIIMLCLVPLFAIPPAIVFLLGFVYGNIGYIVGNEYEYVYSNGVLSVRRKRTTQFRVVACMQLAEAEVHGYVLNTHALRLTNQAPNITIHYQDKAYAITADDYLQALLGEEHVY